MRGKGDCIVPSYERYGDRISKGRERIFVAPNEISKKNRTNCPSQSIRRRGEVVTRSSGTKRRSWTVEKDTGGRPAKIPLSGGEE